MHTCAEFMEVLFAIAFCGAVIVPINARYKASELGLRDRKRRHGDRRHDRLHRDSVNFVERLRTRAAGACAQSQCATAQAGGGAALAQCRAARQNRVAGFCRRGRVRAAGEERTTLQVHVARVACACATSA
jgi:hypothetical protein